MPTVWGLLFSRLEQLRTHKFARSLLMFLALFVCKQGAAAVAGSIEGVQPGLTLMVLQTVGVVSVFWRWPDPRSSNAVNPAHALYPQTPTPRSFDAVPCCLPLTICPCVQVWLPTMPSINGGQEEKLLVVATARMLSDSTQLAAPEAAELAGRLLAALVASLEGSGGASGSEEPGEEGPGEEEVAGYSAAYARLHNAYK
jgi:exportin-2 (importin alpha re-exporter)